MQKEQTTARGETPTFNYTFDIPVEVAAAVCKYRHDRWKIEWGKPQFPWLDVAIGSISTELGCAVHFRSIPEIDVGRPGRHVSNVQTRKSRLRELPKEKPPEGGYQFKPDDRRSGSL
jgi:hypothetical protein